jgi:hypothetical protein
MAPLSFRKSSVRAPWLLTLCITALVATQLSATGCKVKSRSEREADQAARAADEAARAETKREIDELKREAKAESKAESAENKRRDVAARDLEERIEIYQAMAGSYLGHYEGLNHTPISIALVLEVANLPEPVEPHRTQREGDVIARTGSVSIEGRVQEYIVDSKGHVNLTVSNCFTENVKVDLARGTLRLSCAAGTGSIRYYEFGLDYLDADFETTDLPADIEKRSRRVSENLASHKIQRVGALHVSINSQFANFPNGKLWRQASEPANVNNRFRSASDEWTTPANPFL